jgi:hypothetical protein
MVLVYLAPALVALWVRVVRRTRLPVLVWLGIGLAVAGLALVAQIWQGARLDLLGVAAGLAAAICSAGYFLLGEHGASRHDSFGLTSAPSDWRHSGHRAGAVPRRPWPLGSLVRRGSSPNFLGGGSSETVAALTHAAAADVDAGVGDA